MADIDYEKIKSEKRKIKWEKQKAKGKTRFVVFWVVVFIIESILISLIQYIIDKGNCDFSSYLVVFIIFCGLGLIAGNSEWNKNMRKFG